jgi:hypothetical protein
MLLEDRRGAAVEAGAVPVRRYRLARVRFERPEAPPRGRFEYLKRSYD